jgi:hypothetical protein
MGLDAFERCLIAFAAAVVLALAVFLIAEHNKPTITLKKNEWVCAKTEPRTQTQTVLVGKVPVSQRVTRDVCIQYNRLDD